VIELTGFDIGEIDARLEFLEAQPAKTDPADQIEGPASGAAVTRTGDLWRLGEHRLYCGSSLERSSYERLLDGRKARAVWSDPPYNVKIDGHVSGLGKNRHREFAMATGEMAEDEFVSFLAIAHGLCKQHSVTGALHYICMDAAHSYELLTAARQIDLVFKTTCIWAKTSAGMGSLYRSQTEFVHVFKNGGDDVQHINNVQLGKFGRSRTTLWTYAGVNCFGRNRSEDLASHPTVKPWAMVADAIKDSTRHGELVLDPFCGSGTTIIAAQKCGRIAFGIEIDPDYVDVAIRRWQKVTSQQAVHAQTGLTFAETEQRMSEALGIEKAMAADGDAANDRSAGLE
jgi:DNA modification methylase